MSNQLIDFIITKPLIYPFSNIVILFQSSLFCIKTIIQTDHYNLFIWTPDTTGFYVKSYEIIISKYHIFQIGHYTLVDEIYMSSYFESYIQKIFYILLSILSNIIIIFYINYTWSIQFWLYQMKHPDK